MKLDGLIESIWEELPKQLDMMEKKKCAADASGNKKQAVSL